MRENRSGAEGVLRAADEKIRLVRAALKPRGCSGRNGAGSGRILPREFYNRPTLTVASELLGKTLVHRTSAGVTSGLIVEVEAYIGEDDPACHAAPGLTARNAPLYGPPGHAYVYLNYGMHYLVNVVTETKGFPAAVLLRALVPLEGTALMRRRRRAAGRRARLGDHDLCRGPGNLTRAMGITLRQNRLDLCGERLFIEERGDVVEAIVWTPRIGISVGTDREWRCYAVGQPAVSGKLLRKALNGVGVGI